NARAQSASSGAAQETIESWNDVGRKLIAMAEDFPEAKYDYKPTPEVRSFAQQLLHVVADNQGVLALAQGKRPNWDDLPREKYRTKAQVVAVLKQSVSDAVAWIKQKGDTGMSEPMTLGKRTVSTRALFMMPVEHMAEHYGQLV